jgi:transketolase
VKGSGVSFVANKEGWHGKALDAEQEKKAIAELGGVRHLTVKTARPGPGSSPTLAETRPLRLPTYAVGSKEATRKAFGDALVAVGGSRPDTVVFDAEVCNSTHTDEFKKAFPDRFFEMFIAEQQMLGAVVGFAALGKVAYASTFAAFLTRAYDQIRMAAVSNVSIRLSGSHAGVSIGQDGPSQMALEDLAMMRAVCGSTVLYPCDANQTARLVGEMATVNGISYLRTTREKTPIIYPPGEQFPVGGSKVVRRSDKDAATVVAAGITLHEALKAYDQLKAGGVAVRVIDAYSVKPIDTATLRQSAKDTGGKLIVVEDHWAEGGLGDAVLEAFSGGGTTLPTVVKLAVRKMPGSGSPAELLNAAGIDAEHIVRAVRSLL